MPHLNVTFVLFFFYFIMSIPDFRKNFETEGIRQFVRPITGLLILMSIMTTLYNFSGSTNAYSEVRQLLMCCVFFVLVANDLRRYPKLETHLNILFLISLVLMTALYFIGIGIVVQNGRTSLFGVNSNLLAFWYSFAILLTLRTRFESNNAPAISTIFLLFIPAFVFIIAYTGSRSSLVFLFLTISLFVILFPLSVRKKIPFLMLGAAAIVFAADAVLKTDIVKQRIRDQLEDETYGGRAPIWRVTEEVIENHPFFGIGASGFESTIQRKLGHVWSPHNEYFLILSYTGAVGFFCFAVFLFNVGKKAYRLYRERVTVVYGVTLVGLLFFFYTSGGFLTSFTLWFIFALIACKSSNLLIPRRRGKSKRIVSLKGRAQIDKELTR